HFPIILFFLISLLLSIFLMMQQSQFIWDAIPHMAFFQYPWRFLILASFFTSFLAGAGFLIMHHFFAQQRQWIIWGTVGAVIFVLLLLNAKLFMPQTIKNTTAEEYTNTDMLTWTTARISDE